MPWACPRGLARRNPGLIDTEYLSKLGRVAPVLKEQSACRR